MCDECERLTIGDRNAPMHPHLRSLDTPVRSSGDGWVINYRCEACQALWHFRTDPQSPSAGFHRGAHVL